jgi:hypothetical protein
MQYLCCLLMRLSRLKYSLNLSGAIPIVYVLNRMKSISQTTKTNIEFILVYIIRQKVTTLSGSSSDRGLIKVIK